MTTDSRDCSKKYLIRGKFIIFFKKLYPKNLIYCEKQFKFAVVIFELEKLLYKIRKYLVLCEPTIIFLVQYYTENKDGIIYDLDIF